MNLYTIIFKDGSTWLTQARSIEDAWTKAANAFMDAEPSRVVTHLYDWKCSHNTERREEPNDAS